MVKYRISKYNPAFRDKNDRYVKEGWTSYSDIGKCYEGNFFEIDEYIDMEEKYIQTLMLIIDENRITTLQVCEVEQNFTISEIQSMLKSKGLSILDEEKSILEHLKERDLIKRNEIWLIIKLVLRECIWCNLKNKLDDFVIEFGYDYYMYVKCDEISHEIVFKIQENGLFVEQIN